MMWRSLILLATTVAIADAAYRSVCYYTNWSQYRSGKGKFVPEDIDPSLCTHVMYAFAKLVNGTIEPFEWNDDSTPWSKGMYERTMDLKRKNPNLKVLLAVGGYNLASLPFVQVVQSAASRSAFVQSSIGFLRQRDFDGIDVDWEYPAQRGSTAADRQNFVYLMQELRHAFEQDAQATGKPRLLLTGAVPAGKDTIDQGYDIPALAAAADFLSLMTYDFHGSWEQETGMNSPLYAHTADTGDKAYLNLDWVARYYVSKGAPKSKLNIGIATYGRSFNLDSASQTGYGAPAGRAGDAGSYTGENGFISYYEICELIQRGAQVTDVPSQRNRYMVSGKLWAGYDDVQSVKEKACYTKQNGFGGVMFWALDLDDFKGSTCQQGRYPLISAAVNEMRNPSTSNCVANPNPGTGTVPVVQPQTPTLRPFLPPTTQNPVRPGPFPQTTTASMVPANSFNCQGKGNDFYPDPQSCDHFYLCTNSVSYRVRCALGLKFNRQLKHCDFAHSAGCQLQPSPSGSFIQSTLSPAQGANPTPITPTPFQPTYQPALQTAGPSIPQQPSVSNPCAGK